MDKFQSTLMITVVVQAITLAVVILGLPASRSLANRLLVCFILLMAIYPSIHYFGEWNAYTYPLVFVGLLAAPVLYFYVQVLTGQTNKFHWPWLWYFPVTLTVHFLLYWLLFPVAIFGYTPDADYYLVLRLMRLAAALVFVIYLTLTLKKVFEYQRRIKNYYSDIDRFTLAWLQKIVITMLVFFSMLALYYISKLFMPFGPEDNQAEGFINRVLHNTCTIMLFFFIAIGGVQHQFALGASTPRTREIDPDQQPQRHQLSESVAELLWQQANDHLKAHQSYLDSDLLLPSLAAAMKCGARDLSQAINQVSGENFYDFINGYRVQKARELMSSKPEMAIHDIALEAGFSNRATFYKHFKKHFSATPAQYRKQQAQSDK